MVGGGEGEGGVVEDGVMAGVGKCEGADVDAVDGCGAEVVGGDGEDARAAANVDDGAVFHKRCHVDEHEPGCGVGVVAKAWAWVKWEGFPVKKRDVRLPIFEGWGVVFPLFFPID
ncbi:MAG: hypothetical protein SP1CHLAM54_15680 [Chlamydiia bacterium]|nr:hypothetical protein [Chlamydiia bacterium]MCH9616458.1 hypothetical protein [Chlamydiia bacterium]MCH9629556.1 hypothetical protein [Chlamydiia bacterium]